MDNVDYVVLPTGQGIESSMYTVGAYTAGHIVVLELTCNLCAERVTQWEGGGTSAYMELWRVLAVAAGHQDSVHNGH